MSAVETQYVYLLQMYFILMLQLAFFTNVNVKIGQHHTCKNNKIHLITGLF